MTPMLCDRTINIQAMTDLVAYDASREHYTFNLAKHKSQVKVNTKVKSKSSQSQVKVKSKSSQSQVKVKSKSKVQVEMDSMYNPKC